MTGKETDPNPTEATVVLFFVIFVFIGFIAAGAGGAVFSDTAGNHVLWVRWTLVNFVGLDNVDGIHRYN